MKFQYWPIRVVGWRQCRSGGASEDSVVSMREGMPGLYSKD